MSKLRYFNIKFSKIAKRWGLSASSVLLTPDFGNLKLCDLPKIEFFKRIMTNANSKKHLIRHFSDVIVITSPRTVTKLTFQEFSMLGTSQLKFLATPVYSWVT